MLSRLALPRTIIVTAACALGCSSTETESNNRNDSHSGGADSGSGGTSTGSGGDDAGSGGGAADTGGTGGAPVSTGGEPNLGGEASGGGGGADSGGTGGADSGGSGGVGICGPSGPLPASECIYRRECREDESWEMYNPFGENCVCYMRLAEECELGCDASTGACNE